MKKQFTTLKSMVLFTIFLAIFGNAASATTFTAVLSGDFNSSLTWGGLVPGSLLTSDIIVIPVGITVTLNTDETISGSASMTVNGTLTSSTYNTALNLSSGSLSGSGSITVDTLTLGLTSGFAFTGTASANVLTSTGANMSSAANVTVNNALDLTGGTLSIAAGTITMGSGSTINVMGGAVTTSGSGALDLHNVYNVMYTASSTGGIELHGSGLSNVTVNVPGAVTLSSNDTVNGMLTLTGGTLSLNGHSLVFNGSGNLSSSGSGTITGNSLSNIIVNTTGSLSGTLNFAGGGNTLDNLTINTSSSSGHVNLGGDLGIDGMLTLSSGTLGLNGHTLTLNSTGNLASGSGTLTGSATSNLIINTTSGLTGMLNFSGSGNTLSNLTINSGSASNMIGLGSDLSISGLLTLTTGELGLNGHTLTINSAGNIVSSANGTLNGSATSNLVINAAGSLTGMLNFASGGNMLHNLTLNTGAASDMASLGSNLGINGTLALTSGTLSLNGHTLTLNATGDLTSTAFGMLHGSALSNLVINTTGNVTGALNFASGADSLNNLIINMGSASGVVNLGSNLMVNGMLNLMQGRVALGNYNLGITSTGSLSGGSTNSYVVTNGTGDLMMNLAADNTDSFQVGTLLNYAPMIVTANSGSATGNVGLNVMNGVMANGTSGTLLSNTDAMVNATWDVTSSATTGINYTLMPMWSAGMEVNSFDRTNAFVSHYTAGAWDSVTASAAGTSGSMYYATRTGITSLSPFMVTNRQPAPTAVATINKGGSDIVVYPIPTAGTLYFTAGANVDNVTVYGMDGRMLKTASSHAGAIAVDDMPAGTYLVRFTGKDINEVRKFVKE